MRKPALRTCLASVGLTGCLALPDGVVAPADATVDAAPPLPGLPACEAVAPPAPVVHPAAPIPGGFHAACPAARGVGEAPGVDGRVRRALPGAYAGDVDCDGDADLLLLDADDPACRGLKLIPGGPGGPQASAARCLFGNVGREGDADRFRGFLPYDLAGGAPDGLLDVLVVAEPVDGATDWRLIAFVGHDGPGFHEAVKRGSGTGLDAVFAGLPATATVALATAATPVGPLIVLGARDRGAAYIDPTEIAAWQVDPVHAFDLAGVSGVAILPGAGGHGLAVGADDALVLAPGAEGFTERVAGEAPRGPLTPGRLGGQAGVFVVDGADLVFARARADGQVGGRRAAGVAPGAFSLLASGEVGGDADLPDVVLVDATPGAERLRVVLDPRCADPDGMVAGQVLDAALPDDLGPVGVAVGAFEGEGPEILLYNPAGRMLRWRVLGGALARIDGQ
ncbi:MAG: hypothetical protein H6706_26380 [Myxococcales bacterium]|nr:hypothetical protein [Myxococcales bacterium]